MATTTALPDPRLSPALLTLTMALTWTLAGSGCGRPDVAPPARPATPTTTAPALVPALSPPVDPGADRGFVGVVVAGESVAVEPRIEGRILEVLVKPGDRVTRGTPLARLDLRAAGHQLASARAALADATRRLSRRRKLARLRPDAVTVEEMDGARREVLQERARVAELRAARDESTVRAPFDGTVADRYLLPGGLCGPGRPLLRLVGQGEARVRFAIPEEHASQVKLGTQLKIFVGAVAAPLAGRVSGISPEVDAASRTVHAAATLEPAAESSAEGQPSLTTGLVARVFPVQARADVGPSAWAP